MAKLELVFLMINVEKELENMMILALTTDGRITYCNASDDCDHVDHQIE